MHVAPIAREPHLSAIDERGFVRTTLPGKEETRANQRMVERLGGQGRAEIWRSCPESREDLLEQHLCQTPGPSHAQYASRTQRLFQFSRHPSSGRLASRSRPAKSSRTGYRDEDTRVFIDPVVPVAKALAILGGGEAAVVFEVFPTLDDVDGASGPLALLPKTFAQVFPVMMRIPWALATKGHPPEMFVVERFIRGSSDRSGQE